MILAVLQARSSSKRLPGKVLKPILGVPMILRQIERIRRSKRVDQLILATSSDSTDDALANLCQANQVPCFRGNLDDVLDRFYRASEPFAPEHVVRLTGDCPLTEPVLIDRLIEFHLDGNYDYSSNALQPTFPDGLDVEVVRFEALRCAWRESKTKREREHVTPFFYDQPHRFRIGSFKNADDLSHLRWTVDEPADFEFVTKVYEALYPVNPGFGMQDILNLLNQNPALATVNQNIRRNEGLNQT